MDSKQCCKILKEITILKKHSAQMNTKKRNAVQYSALQYSTVQRSTTQLYTLQYNANECNKTKR